MKTTISIILLAFLVNSFHLSAQDHNQKATLYIVRTSNLGPIINFKYFVDDQYFGKCNRSKYLKIELSPGKHLIWAKSENRSFLEAALEAGKTYLINAEVRMGFVKAAVKLAPIQKGEKKLQKAKKFISKRELLEYDPQLLKEEQVEFEAFIQESLGVYEEKFKGTEKVAQLTEPVELD